MESATDEFIYTANFPDEPDPLAAQILEVNGHRYVLHQRFNSIKIVSHRYPPHIPMSVDEQAVPPEISPSLAAKIPELVHEQLVSQFLPASKNLGQAGMHLLKTYYMFQEALSNYCDATHKLIKSADTAGNKSKHEARELSKVFKQFVQGVNAHQKVITDFDALANKVHDYSSKEKEKLKSEYSEYKAKEKKLMKRKNGETEQDIIAFHRKEAANWSKQQELRYKFFNDKLHAWINGYVEIGKLFQMEPMNSQPVVGIVVTEAHVEAPAHPDSHADWHHELHEDAAVVAAEEAKEKAETFVDHGTQDSRSNSTSSVATTLEDLPRRTTNEMSGVTLVSSHRRQSIEIEQMPLHPQPAQRPPPISTYSAPPALPPKPVEQQYSPIRQSVPGARHDENAYAPRHHVVAEQVPQQPINSAPGGVRRAGNTIPGAVNVFGFANQSNPQPNVRYTPVQNGAPYQVVTRENIRVGRVVDNPVTEEQMNAKKFHVDASYVPMASPSHQPQHSHHGRTDSTDISVPSYFNPSQYGSILIVNDDFNASSGEQMTVNRGDKVILLKCGSRGWVFVRDSISNRTGWVPEPYVNP